jgi:hypothetical protein
VSDPVCRAGIGLYTGTQDHLNGVYDAPPAQYLFSVSAELAARSRYQAPQGVRVWHGADLYLFYFVDLQERIVFAQPDDGEDSARREAWHSQTRHDWSFQDARALSRWLGLHFKYITDRAPRSKLMHRLPEIWREYVTGGRTDSPPVPLGLPLDPEVAFAGQGWLGWKDWFWEERTRQPPDKAKAGDMTPA